MPGKIIIIPHVGFDWLHLGIEMSYVLDMLDQPDDRSFNAYNVAGNSIDSSVDWSYLKLGIQLTFDSDDDWVLGSITVESELAELAGKRFIGMDENVFLEEANEAEINIAIDDDFKDLNCKNYNCDELDLFFWVSESKLTSITIFPKHDETDEIPLWPDNH